MLESDDGLIWRKRAAFQEIAGDETAFLFDQQGGILGIGRRRGMAQLLQSNPPYTKWIRRNLDRHIGGPLIGWSEKNYTSLLNFRAVVIIPTPDSLPSRQRRR